MDPQPEAFLPLVPPADLTDPPTTRPAAAVALWARDRRGPPVRFQLRNQARLDDRQQTWSARTFTDTPWMPATSSPRPGCTPWAPRRPRRMPPRRARVPWPGLPAAYVATAASDPLRDEAIASGLRLLQAGVAVELHQWPGVFHGSQAIVSADISQRQNAELAAALHRALTQRGGDVDQACCPMPQPTR